MPKTPNTYRRNDPKRAPAARRATIDRKLARALKHGAQGRTSR